MQMLLDRERANQLRAGATTGALHARLESDRIQQLLANLALTIISMRQITAPG